MNKFVKVLAVLAITASVGSAVAVDKDEGCSQKCLAYLTKFFGCAKEGTRQTVYAFPTLKDSDWKDHKYRFSAQWGLRLGGRAAIIAGIVALIVKYRDIKGPKTETTLGVDNSATRSFNEESKVA